MMNQDGVCNGYDFEQLKKVCEVCYVLLIVFGGVGIMEYFLEVFCDVDVDGVLVVFVFYK